MRLTARALPTSATIRSPPSSDAPANPTLATSSAASTSATARAFFKDSVFPGVQQQLDDIDKLKPPKDLQADVDKLIKDARAALGNLEKQVDQDIEKVLNSQDDPFKDVNQEATSLGLTVCGQNG